MFDMFDFENHDPERVGRVINDLWANPELYDWYNYAGDSEMRKSRIGNCMCWVRTVFVHATDIDRLQDVFELISIRASRMRGDSKFDTSHLTM